jgi:hypothetical protein
MKNPLKWNWNLEMLIFKEGGKPKDPEKKPSYQGREPTNNSTQMNYPSRG